MRAVAVEEFGGPEQLRLVERPVPEPGAEEVSIDVAYAGVGFIDTLLRSGAFPLSRPFVPGIEVTGRIRTVGPDTGDLAPGQCVAALLNDFGRGERVGGYAEVAIAHHTMVAPLPEDADLPRVTAVIANGVAAWMALHDVAHVGPSDRVLVLGASGGLGATTARLAALHPAARVIGVVGHDPSRAPAECTDAVEADELAAWLGDGTVDVVIDPVGGELRTIAFEHLAPFGRHVVLGNASGEDPALSGDGIWLGSRVVAGLSVGTIAHLRPTAVAGALAAVTTLICRGALREPAPAIEPLDRAAAVHRAIADRTAPPKTVLALSSEAPIIGHETTITQSSPPAPR